MRKKLLGILLAIVLVVSLLPAASAAEAEYKLVTDIANLAVGDQIVIVAESANMALGTTQNTNNRASATVTKSGDTVTFGNDVQVITLEAGKTDGTFAFNVGNGYLYAASSSKNHLKTEKTLSANSSWNITIATTGVATIKSAGSYTHNWMRYNASNNPPLFACYLSGQTDICIYKLTASDAPCVEHTWGEATCTVAKTCSACGATEGEALGHTMSDATCTAPKTCSVCGATEGGLAAHSFANGVCSACGISTADIKSVKIYYPNGQTYITATASGSKLTAGDADTAAVWTMETVDEYCFFVCDGKYLTSGETGSSLFLSEDYTDYALWALEEATGGYYLKNKEAKYGGTKPQYIEYYSGFTTFGLNTSNTAIFTFQLEEIVTECEHNWSDATCTAPKTCSKCGETEGEALGHTMSDATCTAPKTCSVCGETEGEALGHGWTDATCQAPKTCSVCGETEGSKVGHKYVDGVCTFCGKDQSAADLVIEDAAGLFAFAEAVNGGDSFAGKVVELGADIDLNNVEWTPINGFKGTFDGKNYTISNLVVTGSNNDVGLFGKSEAVEIKNLTVENAKVSGRLNVGVVAGHPWTTKFTNITVTGHVEVNGMAYVGGVGGKNAYANWTNITVNVDETSYVKANSIEGDKAYRSYVGGVIGFIGEGGHAFTNVISNIDVIGSTSDVGGITGIAHYGNSFINCVCTGDVTVTNAPATTYAEEIGGIAGVWHNQAGYKVTFDNCVFTGTLTANITEGVDLSDNTITGKAYSASGTGELIIKNYVAKIGEVSFYTLADAVAAAQAGETVVLLDNIALTETLVIAKGANVVIDLNGKIISGVDNVAGTSAVIINKGTLEIKDSAEGGKVTTKALYPDTDWSNEEGTFPSYANNTIRNEGTFILTSGTIENTTPAGGATYCIDNYGGSSCTINGGKVINENTLAIRLFCGSGISLTINGGEIIGTRAIWVQLASSDPAVAPEVNVTVTGGTITRTKDTDVALYSYTYGNSAANVNISISGGIFNGDIGLTGGKNKTATETLTITGGTFTDVYSYAADEVASETVTITSGTFAFAPKAAYIAKNYIAVENANGTYTVDLLSLSNCAAAIGETPYATLADAIAAAGEGDVVTLIQTPDYTGLMEADGTWYYFDNGALDTTYTGLVEHNGNWYFVANGVLDWNYTGLVQKGDKLYYVCGGSVNWTYVGLVQNGENWNYVVNGAVNTEYTGLVEYNGSWYYVANGVLDWNCNGLMLSGNNWYYVTGGMLNATYTGLVEYDGVWYYVANGIMDTSYTGSVEYGANTFFVKEGVLDWSCNGLVQGGSNWYSVNGGVVNTGYTSLVELNGAWYYFVNGVLDWSFTGLVEYGGNTFYVVYSALDWSYTGLVEYNGGWYFVCSGAVNTGYSGLVEYGGIWYYVANGVLDWNYTGLVEYGGNWFYVANGVLDWNYCGTAATPDGTEYTVNFGVAVL